MKKVLLSLFVVAALASCKKERTCACTATDPFTGRKITEDVKLEEKMTKKDAKAECDKSDFGTILDCELK